ncbi:caspase family protein [Bradyrhizobium sp.]|jgi:hypothetical protein|uniref:caspase family protein n=1 Tax=Bradyrhizobium sp. TaxID=376 RepID=UPI002E09E390|nr:caspase family protein [Bradyrhizobium sp.]
MKKCSTRLLTAASLALALLPSNARAAPEQTSDIYITAKPAPYKMYGDSRALIVGASKYENRIDWTTLEVVPQEVTRVKEVLERHRFKTTVVPDPNSENLAKAIKGFLSQPATRDTRLLIYFAGHGWTDQRRTGFIVPVDAPGERSPEFLSKILSMEEIKAWSYLSKAKHVLFVFDSCFSGSIFLTRSNLAPVDELFLKDIDRPGRQYITSGNANEQVPDRFDFAEAFAAGLEGQADYNKDGVISASELGYFLRSTIIPQGRQTPQFGSDTQIDFRGGDQLFISPVALTSDKRPAVNPPALEGPRQSALRSIGKPTKPGGVLFEGVEVLYYEKVADEGRVRLALSGNGIPFVSTRAELPERFTANALACGPDIPVESLKRLAKALIGAGVGIKEIRRFQKPSEKPMRIEILSLTKDNAGEVGLTTANLTLNQIDALTGCPSRLSQRE